MIPRSFLVLLGLTLLTRWLSAQPVVVIDPGHGGSDGGAVWYGVKEKDLTLKVAKKLQNELTQRGIKCVMTRTTDRTLSLGQRAAIADRYSDAYLVSIHFNASRDRSAHGIETFYAGDEGRFLARSVHQQLSKSSGLTNRGTKKRKLMVLRATDAPAALVECGFISNRRESKKCSSSDYHSTIAKSLARGIDARLTTVAANRSSKSSKKLVASRSVKKAKSAS